MVIFDPQVIFLFNQFENFATYLWDILIVVYVEQDVNLTWQGLKNWKINLKLEIFSAVWMEWVDTF